MPSLPHQPKLKKAPSGARLLQEHEDWIAILSENSRGRLNRTDILRLAMDLLRLYYEENGQLPPLYYDTTKKPKPPTQFGLPPPKKF